MALDSPDYRKFSFRIMTKIGTTSNVLFISTKSAIFRQKKIKKNDGALLTTLVRI